MVYEYSDNDKQIKLQQLNRLGSLNTVHVLLKLPQWHCSQWKMGNTWPYFFNIIIPRKWKLIKVLYVAEFWWICPRVCVDIPYHFNAFRHVYFSLDNNTSMNLMTRLHIEHDMEHVFKTVNRGIYFSSFFKRRIFHSLILHVSSHYSRNNKMFNFFFRYAWTKIKTVKTKTQNFRRRRLAISFSR